MTDSLVRHYQRKYRSEGPADLIRRERWPADRAEAAMAVIPSLFTGGSVLELAPGSGRLARSLLEVMPNVCSYSAIDISEARVQAMNQSIRDPRFRGALGSVEAMPPAVAEHDLVIMVAIIEHLIDPLNVMRWVRRSLKPGGGVYIDTPNIAKWTRRLRLLSGRFPSTAASNEGLTTYNGTQADLHDEGHLHYFTFRSLSLMLTEHCGFSSVRKLGYAPGTLTRFIGRRGEHALATAWPEMFSEIALIAYA